jgi:hypothetical protein
MWMSKVRGARRSSAAAPPLPLGGGSGNLKPRMSTALRTPSSLGAAVLALTERSKVSETAPSTADTHTATGSSHTNATTQAAVPGIAAAAMALQSALTNTHQLPPSLQPSEGAETSGLQPRAPAAPKPLHSRGGARALVAAGAGHKALDLMSGGAATAAGAAPPAPPALQPLLPPPSPPVGRLKSILGGSTMQRRPSNGAALLTRKSIVDMEAHGATPGVNKASEM